MSGWHKWGLGAGCAAALAALAWVYGTALAAPAVGTFHDDGVYAVTAKALATGRGYRITSLPGEPAQTKYPFLFPALLAAVWRVFPQFPENVIWLKLVPFVCALAWGVLAYRLLRNETGGTRIAWALTGLVAASPWVLFLATTPLSETLFATFLTAALLLLGRMERGDCDWKTVIGAAALGSGAFLTRTAGIAVIGAGVLALLMRSGWRRAGGFFLISAGSCAPWVGWQMGRRPGPAEAYYSAANYADWTVLFHFAPAEKVRIAGQNLLAMLLSPAQLMGVPPTRWGTLLALAAGGLAAAGFVARLRGRLRATEILVSLYAVLVVCWAWPPLRFMAPLLPLLLLYGYEGTLALCRVSHAGVRPAWWVPAAFAIVLILPCARTLTAMADAAHQTGAVIVPNTPYDDWREVMGLVSWLKRGTPPDAVLMSNYDPLFYLYTGRRSVRGFVPHPYRLHYNAHRWDRPVGTPADMMQAIARAHAGYLVCTPNLAFREGDPLARVIGELVRLHPDRFHLLYQGQDTRYRVYGIAMSVKSSCDLSDPLNFRQTHKLLASN